MSLEIREVENCITGEKKYFTDRPEYARLRIFPKRNLKEEIRGFIIMPAEQFKSTLTKHVGVNF